MKLFFSNLKQKIQCQHTSFYNGRFVTGADRQNFENTTRGPQELLVGVSPHDVDQCLGATAGQNDQLTARVKTG